MLKREQFLSPVGIQTPNLPARSPVTLPTTLSRFQNYVVITMKFFLTLSLYWWIYTTYSCKLSYFEMCM